MRDPKRIDRILDTLKKCWKKNPDMRLGQLLVNVNQRLDKEYVMFYIEDDFIEEAIKKFMESPLEKAAKKKGQTKINTFK